MDQTKDILNFLIDKLVVILLGGGINTSRPWKGEINLR
jgi:hypothetical protein